MRYSTDLMHYLMDGVARPEMLWNPDNGIALGSTDDIFDGKEGIELYLNE